MTICRIAYNNCTHPPVARKRNPSLSGGICEVNLFTTLKNYVRMIKPVIITIVSSTDLFHHFFQRLQKHAGYKSPHGSVINRLTIILI